MVCAGLGMAQARACCLSGLTEYIGSPYTWLSAALADEGGLSAGMEPGPEDFGQVERIVLDSMSSEMSVSALVSPQPG